MLKYENTMKYLSFLRYLSLAFRLRDKVTKEMPKVANTEYPKK